MTPVPTTREFELASATFWTTHAAWNAGLPGTAIDAARIWARFAKDAGNGNTLLHIFHLCDAALAPQCPIPSSAHSPAPFFSLDLSSYDDDAVWAASEPGPPIQVLWAGAGARRVCLRYRELVPAPRLAPALGPSSSRSTTHSQRQQQQPLVTPHQPPPPATAATPPIPNFGETRSLIVDFGVSRPDDAALMFVASICACIRSRPPGLVALLRDEHPEPRGSEAPPPPPPQVRPLSAPPAPSAMASYAPSLYPTMPHLPGFGFARAGSPLPVSIPSLDRALPHYPLAPPASGASSGTQGIGLGSSAARMTSSPALSGLPAPPPQPPLRSSAAHPDDSALEMFSPPPAFARRHT